MARPSKLERTWSDAQLTDAVADSSNWRNVMRKLGLNATSAGAIRIVRRDVERLGLDTSHFRGKRIWSDAQLRRAIMDSQSWDELLTTLGLAPGSGDGRIRVKAIDRLVFIVDGDLAIYLIPSRVIAGRVGILLRAYTKYIVGSAAGLMAPRPAVA
jgi:hypothetical protein